MEILVADKAGFCFGVRRALRLAEQATDGPNQVFCLGPLIHNRHVVERLESRGLHTCFDLSEVPPGSAAMIRAHGTGPETYTRASDLGMNLVDATCPFVARVQQKAASFAGGGYQVLVLGDRDHPEAQAIVAHTGGVAVIVSGPEDLQGMELRDRVAVVCQTTQTLEHLRELVEVLLPATTELLIANTICSATDERQRAAASLARTVDLMIVVGGHHSANTRRLAQLCAEQGVPTHHLEEAAEIDPAWLTGVERVGVTAGASTPHEMIEEVVARLGDLAGSGGDHAAE
jgi:4-hydroxy-3-methylbut-2-enyl diphosphate reductase